jgi:hypothetical protein
MPRRHIRRHGNYVFRILHKVGIRGLKTSIDDINPVDVVKENVCFDFLSPFSTAKAFFWVLVQQLLNNFSVFYLIYLSEQVFAIRGNVVRHHKLIIHYVLEQFLSIYY